MRLIAKLPGPIQDPGDEIARGAILALSWAATEVHQRRKKNLLLVRLMEDQNSLWSDAYLSDCSADVCDRYSGHRAFCGVRRESCEDPGSG